MGVVGIDQACDGPGPSRQRITLTVVGRNVVARDQDVVALTFAAVGGASLPSWRPVRTSISTCPVAG